jgi:uncharacterized protein (TIGR00725 family)
MSKFNKQIVVIGSHAANKELEEAAYSTGKEIAKQGYTLVCGGMEGVMEAACKGAKEAGGTTIGILPDGTPEDCNQYLDYIIPSGIGYARNFIVQNSGFSIIMIGGSYGTLSELAYALWSKKKIISLNSKWEKIDPSITVAKDAKDAVTKAVSS